MKIESRIMGVVLCGGQSLRMGRDKGLLSSETGGDVWARIMRDKFTQVNLHSVLSINSEQKGNYVKLFDENVLVVDRAEINSAGPLLGLLSTHLKYPRHDLFLLACDMVDMNTLVLEKLLIEYSSSMMRAVAFKGSRVEPLCAIFSSQGLDEVLSTHIRTDVENSMVSILEELQAKYVSIPDDWQHFFKNYNTLWGNEKEF